MFASELGSADADADAGAGPRTEKFNRPELLPSDPSFDADADADAETWEPVFSVPS